MFKSKKKHGRHSASFDDQPSPSQDRTLQDDVSAYSRYSAGDKYPVQNEIPAYQPYEPVAYPPSEDDASAYSRHGNAEQYHEAVHKQKKRRKRKIGLTVAAIFLVVVLAGAGVAFAFINGIDRNLQDGLDEELLASLTASDSPSEPFYMLLIGVDKSEEREESDIYGGAYRTDSMILARIDPRNTKITLVSIPRDMKVDLKGYGSQKINAAYAFGGPSLAVKTVSEVAGVPIHHYAEIDFNGFEEVVNALGGIDVDVPMAINDPLAGEPLEAGPQTLNGSQALVLCRSRHAYDKYGSGDLMRAANQRMVISAILKKLMSSDPATMTNTVNSLASYITTDFSVSSILGFANTFSKINVDQDVYAATAPTTSSYEDDLWWEVLDKEAWKAMMQRIEKGLPPTEEGLVDPNTGVTLAAVGDGGASASSAGGKTADVDLDGIEIAVRNGAGKSGVAAEAAKKLTGEGAITDTGNADDSNYKKTLIIYNDEADKAQAQLIADILGVGQLKKNTGGTYSFTTDFLVVIGKDWE